MNQRTRRLQSRLNMTLKALDSAKRELQLSEDARRILAREVVAKGTELAAAHMDIVALQAMTETDSLTGLHNRRGFDQLFKATVSFLSSGPLRAHPEEEREAPWLSFLMIDIDHFKQVNDQHGHRVGDRVLIELARRLQAHHHRPNDFVCRLGGEEFAVILPYADVEAAVRIAQALADIVRSAPFSISSGASLKVSLSIGVASVQVHPRDKSNDLLETLYTQADKALYAAKQAGRDRVVF